MIPHGRPVVDAEGAAKICGMAYKTFRNKGVTGDPEFPAPVNPGRRKLLYDLEQVQAYADDRPLPELPQGERPEDLLDEHDAAEVLGVTYDTVRKDRDVGRMPEHVMVFGLVHWPRRVLARVPEQMRPGRGVGGGQPRKA